jgi:hypothetical protein
MALVTIKRSTEWVNRFRKVHIYVDGIEYTTLKNGQQKVINLPQGKYDIEARFNWLGSRKKQVMIVDGEYSILEVKGNKLTTITNATAISVLPVYILYVLPYTGLFMTLSTAILLYLFYILMYGNRYLEIHKVQG